VRTVDDLFLAVVLAEDAMLGEDGDWDDKELNMKEQSGNLE
jgi:hypothetical protein